MNLRSRFLLFIVIFFAVIAAPSWLAVRFMAEGIAEKWAARVVEKQVLYDKSRSLAPILREVALAKQMALDFHVLRWARNPGDQALQRQAFAELERYRRGFKDKSYFIGLLTNGRYYHNNAAGEFAGKEFRYTLSAKEPKDAWFYDLVEQNSDLHINVNPDEELGVVKLWIDILLRGGEGEVLGVAGTGLDLTRFIDDVAGERTQGVTTLFVDSDGVIQLYRDRKLVDYGTISKHKEQKKTIKSLFAGENDLKAVQKSMASLEKQGDVVATSSVSVDGKRHFVGVAYLPEMDWYEITLFDLKTLLPFGGYTSLLLVYIGILAGLLLLFTAALQRYVLAPLRRLEGAIAQVEAGESVDPSLANVGTGEIRGLMRRFLEMSNSIDDSRRTLEVRVKEYTTELDRLTRSDDLTELLNRRGMWERLETELSRCSRESCTLGVLRIDIDQMKVINDDYGHDVGDAVIRAIAHLVATQLRSYDSVARWGGDGFLVLLTNMTGDALDDLGERLRAKVEACNLVRAPAGEVMRFTVSVGGHLQRQEDTIDSLLRSADLALLGAKERGRNRYSSSRGD